jgi:hypothetical protein
LLKLNTKKRKAQFFILSAFAIVGILYVISSWVQPFTIIDTSSIILMNEPFVFNNIVEKARQTTQSSVRCEDLKYNLDEYANFVNQLSSSMNMKIYFTYTLSPCGDSPPPVPVTAEAQLKLISTRANLQTNFTMEWIPS